VVAVVAGREVRATLEAAAVVEPMAQALHLLVQQLSLAGFPQ